jgi:hypothetical protein
MRKGLFGLLLVAGLSALMAIPAQAQMWFFPDYALPSGFGTSSKFVAASYGRGLNDESGQLNAYGAAFGTVGTRISAVGGFGVANASGNSEATFGGAVGADFFQRESVAMSIQVGLGWMSPESVTALRMPLGVAIKGSFGSESTRFSPWIMPRLNYVRLSGDTRAGSSYDFGVSGGASVNFSGGFGIHAALDALMDDSTRISFGVGGHYVIGS